MFSNDRSFRLTAVLAVGLGLASIASAGPPLICHPFTTGNGAPLRLRVERQCGYKNLKFLRSIQVVDSVAGFGKGTGGTNSDFGFHWFAGV